MTLQTIVSRRDQPSLFLEWETAPEFAKGQEHPVANLAGERYCTDTFCGVIDTSFAIVRDGNPQLLIKCNVLGSMLGYFSQPMNLLPREGLDQNTFDEIVPAVFERLDAVASKNKVNIVGVHESLPNYETSAVERECIARDAKIEHRHIGLCDLTLSETEIHGHIRKSFKSLVNWGRRNLVMKYFSAKNPDHTLFDSYREFHAQIAGRITRSDESWSSMQDWVLSGTGELALAYLDSGELVAGTMTVDGTKISVYASGVYDRARFEMPLAHFPLYDAIQRSRERGVERYELGHLPEKDAVNDKEYNIGFFKRGFATQVSIQNVWKYVRAVKSAR